MIETAAEAEPTSATRERAVIVLRYYEDLGEVDIAEILGWPVGTVKSTNARGLAKLRKLLDEEVK